MMRNLLILFAFIPISAFANEPGPQIAALMMGYHGPPERAVLEAVTPDARRYLEHLAQDQKTPMMQRYNAIAALSAWSDAQTLKIYGALLADPNMPEGGLHRILGLIGQVFGQEGLPLVHPFLDHPDVQLRLSAIDAVAHLPGGASDKVLLDLLRRERHEAARTRLLQWFQGVRKPGARVR